MHYCFRIIQVSTFLWLQEIYIIDARRFQTIWIKKVWTAEACVLSFACLLCRESRAAFDMSHTAVFNFSINFNYIPYIIFITLLHSYTVYFIVIKYQKTLE